MSIYQVGNTFEYNGTLWEMLRKQGRVELWKSLDSGWYQVLLYRTANVKEDFLMWKRMKSEDRAHVVFDAVVGILRS
ncbi:MAG: hypothetical protein U9N44_02910 [Chloroflexota bacterium]|nr:hypothetical protein [Chloroflexota bacterium]